MKLVYISSGDVSVYESQVLELLTYLKNEIEEVILLQGYSSNIEKNVLLEKHSRHTPIKTIWFKSFHCYPLYENKWIDSIYKAIREICNINDIVLHVRNEYTGYLVKKTMQKYHLDIPMLIDIRGLVYEELKYQIHFLNGKNKYKFLLQKWYFKKIYKNLFVKDNMRISISSVSPLINEYIKKNYPDCHYKQYFHPNIAGKQFKYSNEGRRIVREALCIDENDIVAICSTAGNSIWQKDYLIVEHLAKMGIKIINLSKNKLDIANVTTMTVKFTDMPAYLSAADIAILWRDNTFMNNSASPSKFSEFSAMGLYVIHNKSVANAIDYIKESGSGLLVDKIEDIQILPTSEEFKSKRIEWIRSGEAHFGIKRLASSYIATYMDIKSKRKD